MKSVTTLVVLIKKQYRLSRLKYGVHDLMARPLCRGPFCCGPFCRCTFCCWSFLARISWK